MYLNSIFLYFIDNCTHSLSEFSENLCVMFSTGYIHQNISNRKYTEWHFFFTFYHILGSINWNLSSNSHFPPCMTTQFTYSYKLKVCAAWWIGFLSSYNQFWQTCSISATNYIDFVALQFPAVMFTRVPVAWWLGHFSKTVLKIEIQNLL